MLRKICCLFLLFACTCCLRAQTFDFNDSCRKAYNVIIALKLDEGYTLLKSEENQHPGNLIAVYLENYVDFLNVYTSDNRTLYEQLKKSKDLRLAQLMEGDTKTPYWLFTQAEVNLQWAALDIKFGEYLNAVFGIRRAFKLLEENQKYFPDFKANKKSLGVLYSLLGSVPDKYKWGVNLLGMEGNIEKGMGYLNELVDYGKKNDFIYRQETVTYYAFLLLQLQNNSEAAWKALQENGLPEKDNLMNVYTCAHIGVYGKHNDEALQMLHNRPVKDSFAKFPFLDYLEGLGKIGRLDSDADGYFKKFIAAYKGENHIKSSFQKIAWCYLLKRDTLNYFHFMEQAGKFGASTLDADKQAKREWESKRIPNADLLRPRLLFDGGYYQKAADEMNKLSENSFAAVEDKTEYLYRRARIYDEQGKQDSAIVYYEKAINKGRDIPRYFAANSAFETGKIYEARGEKQKAIDYYNLCISFKEHEYKNGLDQKAKAGLNRLK